MSTVELIEMKFTDTAEAVEVQLAVISSEAGQPKGSGNAENICIVNYD